MARETTYVVQPFSLKGKKLVPDQPIAFKEREDALRRARRAAENRAGVILTARTGDPDTDDWDEPELMFKAGKLPPGVTDED